MNLHIQIACYLNVQWEFSKSFLKQLHHIHNSKKEQDNPSSIIQEAIIYFLGATNAICSCREQTRYVRHKYYLTLVRHLLSRLLSGWYMLLMGILEWSVWTREGLPAEGTPKLKLAKSRRKSNLVIREVMNAPCLGCRWAWASAQALSLIIVGLMNLRSALISLSSLEWSVQAGYSFSGLGRYYSSVNLGWLFFQRLRSVRLRSTTLFVSCIEW